MVDEYGDQMYEALDEIFTTEHLLPLKPEVIRSRAMLQERYEQLDQNGATDGPSHIAQKHTREELEKDWEHDVHIVYPRFPRLVRDLLNSGVLEDLIQQYDPKNANSNWTFQEKRLVALAFCAMELGCTLPRGFQQRLKSNYHRVGLSKRNQNRVRQACDEYVDGKPYSFASLVLVESPSEFGFGRSWILNARPPGLEPETTPIVEEYFLRFAPDTCANCGATRGHGTPGLKQCRGCQSTLYCFEGCQKWHWALHREHCEY